MSKSQKQQKYSNYTRLPSSKFILLFVNSTILWKLVFLPRVETRGIIEARYSAPVTETKSMLNCRKNLFEPSPLLQLLRILGWVWPADVLINAMCCFSSWCYCWTIIKNNIHQRLLKSLFYNVLGAKRMITDWLQGLQFLKKYSNENRYFFFSRLNAFDVCTWLDKMTRYALLLFDKSTNKLPQYAPVSAHLHDTLSTWYVFTPIWARK